MPTAQFNHRLLNQTPANIILDVETSVMKNINI